MYQVKYIKTKTHALESEINRFLREHEDSVLKVVDIKILEVRGNDLQTLTNGNELQALIIYLSTPAELKPAIVPWLPFEPTIP